MDPVCTHTITAGHFTLMQTGKVLKSQAVQTQTILAQTGKVLKNQVVQTQF